MNWISKLFFQGLRFISLALDMVVYTLIRIFYNLFDAVSQVKILEDGLITDIADRIYAIIGVYAIFKVVFVLINMMVNPDENAKGNNSAGKVATRIVVMLALIILVPYIFQKAYELQNAIVKENVIGQIILGNTTNTSNSGTGLSDQYGDAGQNISNQIFSGFVSMHELAINPDVDEDQSDTYLNDDAKSSCAKSYNSLLKLREVVDSQTPNTQGISSIWKVIDDTFDSSSDGETFCLDYKFFISTIAGGLAAYMFIIYCLDIGLRVVKLAFYQLIAPIPIASYVDGKKDGPFQRWYKSCLTEYADLFLRLVIIYTVILLINKVDQILDFSMLSGATGLFAKVVVILGMLMFANQAPQLIMDMFGVKGGNGRFSLNAKEKLSKMPKPAVMAASALGGAAVGAGAMVAGGAGGAVKSLFNKPKSGQTKGDAIKDGLKDTWNKTKIRGKATGAEALARLQSKNYSDKGGYNRSVLASDLRRQAFTGNVNATHGIGGRLASAQSDIMSSLSFQTGKNKSQALRMTGKIAAQLGNYAATLNAQKLELEEQARRGNTSAVQQLSIATDFDAKYAFESFLKSDDPSTGKSIDPSTGRAMVIDPEFQNIPKPNSDEWEALANNYMKFENMTTYKDRNGNIHNLTHAEKESLRNYAEKALGDLKKQVDTLTKNKG